MCIYRHGRTDAQSLHLKRLRGQYRSRYVSSYHSPSLCSTTIIISALGVLQSPTNPLVHDIEAEITPGNRAASFRKSTLVIFLCSSRPSPVSLESCACGL
jgi:hypothetical protein